MGSTPVEDLTPVTMELLPVEMDFGSGVTSLQDLQGGTPVQLQLSIETDEMAEPGEWDMYGMATCCSQC